MKEDGAGAARLCVDFEWLWSDGGVLFRCNAAVAIRARGGVRLLRRGRQAPRWRWCLLIARPHGASIAEERRVWGVVW